MDTTIFFLSCLVSFFLQKFLDKHFPKGGKGTPPPPPTKKKKKNQQQQQQQDYLHGLEMVKSCAN